MLDLLRVGQAVALGRIDHQVKLFVGFLQFVGELHCVLHVDVVVHHAVDEQQSAREIFGGFQDRAAVVTGAVVVKREHVTLGKDRIVQTPIRDRPARDADLK